MKTCVESIYFRVAREIPIIPVFNSLNNKQEGLLGKQDTTIEVSVNNDD